MNFGQYLGAGSGITKLLWHLNGNSNDSSGNGNNGTDTSIDYALANGLFGIGALTNAATDDINKATDLGINGQGAITVSRWIKLTSEITSGIWCFWSHRSTVTADRYFQMGYDWNGGTIRLDLYASDAGGINVFTKSLGITSWHNIIGTRASGASPAVKVYLDGVQIISGTGGSTVGSANYFTATLGGAGSQAPLAKHSEIIVENVVWTAVQVQKYYTFAKGRFGILR